MEVKDSYYVKRNGNYIWLSQGVEPLEQDEIVEVRKMLIADDGFTLERDGNIIGSAVWLKDSDSIKNYTEVEIQKETLEANE